MCSVDQSAILKAPYVTHAWTLVQNKRAQGTDQGTRKGISTFVTVLGSGKLFTTDIN